MKQLPGRVRRAPTLFLLCAFLPIVFAAAPAAADPYGVASPMPLEEYLETVSDRLGLAEASELVHLATRSRPGSAGSVVVYGHTFAGIPVVGEGLVAHTSDGLVTAGRGRLSVMTADSELRVDEAAATDAAARALEAELGFREGDMRLDAVPRCDAAFRRGESEQVEHDLYHVCTLSPVGMDDHVAWVDGDSGEVRNLVSTVFYDLAPDTASGVTVYDGVQGPLPVLRDTTNNHLLLMTSDNGVIVFQPDEIDPADPWNPPVKHVYESDVFFFSDETIPGFSVFWALNRALDMMEADLGLQRADLFDGLNQYYGFTQVNAVAEIPYSLATSPGASYNSTTGLLAFGVTGEPPAHRVDREKVGHEFGHQLGWVLGPFDASSPEQAALSEAFAFIYGELLEEFSLADADWRAHGSYAELDLLDPAASLPNPAPDVYQGANWGADPHFDAMVAGRWFTLLAFGGFDVNSAGTPFAVEAIGLGGAAYLLSHTLFSSMVKGDGFQGLRDASLFSASQVCGDYSTMSHELNNAWHAVGLLPASPPPGPLGFSSPADGDTDVPPWPAELAWQSVGTVFESSWQLEVSTDPQFQPGETQTLTVTETDWISGVAVGIAKLFLEPETTYYWRVRSNDSDPAFQSCWRPTRTFTTASMTPTPISPVQGQHHPWGLQFEFTAVEGATSFDIEVGYKADFEPESLVFPDKNFPAEFLNEISTAELTIPVDMEEVWWRVRSRLDEESLTSEWSLPFSFGTSMPRSANISPVGGTTNLYPWPVNVTWEPVEHAEYDVRLWTDEEQVELVTENVQADIDLPAKISYDMWRWDVGVTGPPLGSVLQPEADSTRQKGERSISTNFFADGDATGSVLISPSGDCLPYGEKVTFEWTPVPGAEFYELYVWEHCTGPGCAQPKQLAHTSQHPASAPTKAVIGGLTPHFSGCDSATTQLSWSVRAFADTSIPGFLPDGLYFRYLPYPPDPIGPTGTVPISNGTVLFSWQPIYSPQGEILEIHAGPGCSSLIQSGLFRCGAFANGLAPGETYSWRVRGEASYCNPSAVDPTSACVTIGTAPPPPEPVPDGETAVPCQTQIQQGGNLPETHYIDLGATSGTFNLEFDHVLVADRIQVTYGGQILYDQCLAGHHNVSLDFDGINDWVQIQVLPNCAGPGDTLWAFVVSCPY